MRDESIDEFESIFEQAAIPALEVKDVNLARIALAASGGKLDHSTFALGEYLAKRFDSSVTVHWPASSAGGSFAEEAKARGLTASTNGYGSSAELVGQIGMGRNDLILLSISDEEGSLSIDLDAFVEGMTSPVLITRQPIDSPADVFRKILHCLTGHFQQTQNFSYPFTLTDTDGHLDLLHTIDREQVEGVREALQVSPDIDEHDGDELIETMAHHGERFLKGVVAASKNRNFDVSYQLQIGNIVQQAREIMTAGRHGLLVVGSHDNGRSQVSADDYQLMHQIHEVPVLAL